MSESEPNAELGRLDAEHPALMDLLRRTPVPPEVDTGQATPEELLTARALTILGSAAARTVEDPTDRIVFTGRELQILIGIVADRYQAPSPDVDRLRTEIDQLRESQLTADGVWVLVAKMVGGVLFAAAAIAAIVGAIVGIA